MWTMPQARFDPPSAEVQTSTECELFVSCLGIQFQYDKIIQYAKTKILEKLFRENKTSPLLKTPEKDFQNSLVSIFILSLK